MRSLLIFAHVPPPHHGQSYMVAQLLEELRARPQEIRVFHVDSRVSDNLEEVGRFGLGKVFRTLGYCCQAIWLRWRHGPMLFYYVPAPAARGALYRDWLVMALCRPFFRHRLLLHWHAVGLGKWITEGAGSLTSLATRRLLGGAALSLVLAPTVVEDAAVLHAEQVRVLPNGMPDPCSAFEAAVLSGRVARSRERQGTFRVLFLAHCTREKGLYDALEGVFAAQRQVGREEPPVRLALTVAGTFLNPGDERAFRETVARLLAEWPEGSLPPPSVEYVGFAAGDRKDALFRTSDCFCFPTYYPNEVMPVALIEALAYGLPIVTTRWRAIPAMLPDRGCWLVEPHQPEKVGAALREAMRTEAFPVLREHFLANFRREVFGQRFCEILAECFAEDGLKP